jgi:hypothetical protein
LIITGYIVGLSCLFLISYRTLIAFFSESKAVTIYINRFGEQFIDLFAIIIIWAICIVGLIYLIRLLKKEQVSMQSPYKSNHGLLVDQNRSFYFIKNNIANDNTKDTSNDLYQKLNEQIENN